MKDATTDESIVQRWIEMFGEHEINWALACGQASGVVVVDVDPRNGGDETAVGLELQPTLTTLTGGGGFHNFYASDGPVGSGKLGPGVDFQADGKYVILPPAGHVSGRIYAWRDQFVPLSPLPDGLSQVRIGCATVNRGGDGEPVQVGLRNDYVYSKAADLALIGGAKPTSGPRSTISTRGGVCRPLPATRSTGLSRRLSHARPSRGRCWIGHVGWVETAPVTLVG